MPEEKLIREMRVLVVEDNLTQSTMLRLSLQKIGYAVECVGTLALALNKLSAGGVDVVLLDLSLPDSSGIESFYQLHAFAEAVPIVVLSATDDEDTALQALQHGAQDYLIKGRVADDSIVRCLRYAVERNQIELAFRENERRTRLIIENSLDAFVAVDEDGLITDWNLQAEKIFGWTRKEVLGHKIGEIIVPPRLRAKHQDYKDHLFAVVKGRLINKRREMYVLNRGGEEIPVEVAAFPVEDGKRKLYCAYINNISERKAIEEKTRHLNEELERRVQQRTADLIKSNEELAQFAKVASHDLQEPLRAVQGFVELLAKRYKGRLDKDADDFINYIIDGTKRMQELIAAVLSHSQIKVEGDHLTTVTDCHSVIKEVMTNLKQSIDESQALFKIGDLPPVAVERVQLVQLFQNLINNALKYRSSEPPMIDIQAELSVDRWLFTVRDNGIGVDPKYTEKIFDMFARLHGKTQYTGTGIGLAICKKIVTAHGGKIWMESEPGEGSIVYFSLPAVAHATENA